MNEIFIIKRFYHGKLSKTHTYMSRDTFESQRKKHLRYHKSHNSACASFWHKGEIGWSMKCYVALIGDFNEIPSEDSQ